MDVPFFGLPNQPDIRIAHATPLGLARVLGPVEDEDLTRYSFRSNQVWVVWHITSTVDFAGVVDALDDLDAGVGLPGGA